MENRKRDLLIDKGVKIDAPYGIHVDNEIDCERISGDNVTLHTGCKIYGHETLICEGAEIGFEGPVTIRNCCIGPHVKLKGGYFENAVFLEGAVAGSGSHIRAGTILEEQASIAHTVGLKQTILFPFVTLGSLINFCDCLMAGGNSSANHSEVGSSYIHFNYTPNQDKATPSLIGDVPRGVMLNQSPIFLGGQGGLVGPCRLAYGTILAAGSICRKDVLQENHLVIEGPARSGRVPYKTGSFHNLKRIISHNLTYIGNLYALSQWYRVIRRMFVGQRFPEPLLEGLIDTLALGIAERIKQLKRLKDKVQSSLSAGMAGGIERAFCDNWDAIESALTEAQAYQGDLTARDRFSEIVQRQIQESGKAYLACIKSLTPEQTAIGSVWLQSIVDHLTHYPSVQLQ